MISCLVIESVAERGVLKSPTLIVDLFIFFFSMLSVFASGILKLCCLGHTFRIPVPSLNVLSLYIYLSLTLRVGS